MRTTSFSLRAATTTGVLVGLGLTTWAALSGYPVLIEGSDQNNIANPFVQPQDPALSGGGRDQSQQFGDVLMEDPSATSSSVVWVPTSSSAEARTT